MNGFDRTFQPSGATHRAGSVPDPGSTAGTTRTLYENAEWREPLGVNAPLLVAYPSSIVSLCSIWRSQPARISPAVRPVDWTTLAFDDTGWPEGGRVRYGPISPALIRSGSPAPLPMPKSLYPASFLPADSARW